MVKRLSYTDPQQSCTLVKRTLTCEAWTLEMYNSLICLFKLLSQVVVTIYEIKKTAK